MDPNDILTWIVGGLTTLQIIGGLRRSGKNTGWLVVFAVVIAILVICLVVARDYAGYIAGGVWGIFVFLPFSAMQAVYYCSIKKRYTAARRIATVAAILHPVDGWRQHSRLFGALEMAHRGEIDAARQVLEEYKTETDWFGRLSCACLYRLDHQWGEYRLWFENERDERDDLPELDNVVYYLRSLGETGDLNGMAAEFADLMPLFKSRGQGDLRHLCRLFLFAFTGRVDALERLFRGPLAIYPEQVRHYWLATAHLAAGNDEQAMQAHDEVMAGSDCLARHEVELRFEHHLSGQLDSLNLEVSDLIDDEELELSHDERYSAGALVQRSRAAVTLTMLLLNSVAFGLQTQRGGSMRRGNPVNELCAVLPDNVKDGEWWRVLTATFLHFGSLHLVMNMAALLILGPYLEFVVGRLRFIIVYLVAGIGSMALVVVATPIGADHIVLGASGSIMGVVGATAAVYLRGWRRDRAAAAHRRLWMIITIVLFQTVFDIVTPQVSFLAHFGGACIGFLMGSLLRHDFAALDQE
jgi:rhomboid protease GluP